MLKLQKNEMNADINYVNDYEGCPYFLINHFIHLDYKQFMKISHETIAPWSLFPHTFITGVNGNRISQQYLILGISSEELNSLSPNVSIPILMVS